MVKALTLFAVAGVAGAETVKLTYTDCGSSSTHAKITDLKPDTIDVPGKATVVGSGDLDADQTSASFSLKVKKAGIPLVSGKGSICEDTTIKVPLGAGSFTVKGIDCPAKAGSVSVQVDLDILSDLVEEGDNSLLSIHIDADADDTKEQVICLDIDASLASDERQVAGIPGQIFMEGFIAGFIGEAEHIKKCVSASEACLSDAGSMFSDLKAHKFTEAVNDLQALIGDVGTVLPTCKDAGKDLQPILDAFKGVKSIKDLMAKLKNNFLAHDRDILNLLEDELQVCTFGAPDAHKCGLDLGKQIRSVVIGDQFSSPQLGDHGKIFMEGFLEGFIGEAKHIKACVGQSEACLSDAGSMISDLKARKITEAVNDLQALVGDIGSVLPTCKDAVKDLAPLLTAFKDVHGIKDLMNKLKNNFLAHDKEMIDILEDAIEVCTFGAPDAHKCGEDFGREARSLVIGDQLAVLV
jgi:hypothetical protein